MKNLDLNKCNLQEISKEEALTINGGSWVGDAFRAVKDVAVDVYEWVADHFVLVVSISPSGYTPK
jgi:hypothetical protein